MEIGMDVADERGEDRIADETMALYRALRLALDPETADRLFPTAWRHLRRIRSGPQVGKHHIRL